MKQSLKDIIITSSIILTTMSIPPSLLITTNSFLYEKIDGYKLRRDNKQLILPNTKNTSYQEFLELENDNLKYKKCLFLGHYGNLCKSKYASLKQENLFKTISIKLSSKSHSNKN